MSTERWPMRHNSLRAALLVFLRAPELGRVKTRLASRVGDAKALEIYEQLVSICMTAVRASELCEPVLVFTPADAGADLERRLGSGFPLHPQHDGGLGDRLRDAFERAFDSGSTRVIAIGTDAPDITPELIDESAQRLASYDMVLGPATDGGYWLIGLSRRCDAVFENIPWSDPNTAAATLDAARHAGLRVSTLPLLSDVDTVEDLDSWRTRQTV